MSGVVLSTVWEFPKIRGTFVGSPYNKDPTIYCRYYIRVPYFRKLPKR